MPGYRTLDTLPFAEVHAGFLAARGIARTLAQYEMELEL